MVRLHYFVETNQLTKNKHPVHFNLFQDKKYIEVVKNSKTLTSIKHDIEFGLIRTVEDLQHSMALLFANLAMFYRSNVEVSFIYNLNTLDRHHSIIRHPITSNFKLRQFSKSMLTHAAFRLALSQGLIRNADS